jgi:hypothetical protein
MAEEKTEIALSVSGEAVVGRALDNTANKLEGVETATKHVTQANVAASKSTAQVAAGFERFQSTIGVVGQGLGRLSPTLGAMTAQFGATTGAAAGASSAFGALGGIAAGAAGGAAILATAARSLDEQFRKVSQSGRSLSDELAAGFGASSKASGAMRSFDALVSDVFGTDGFTGLVNEAGQAVRAFGGLAGSVFADVTLAASTMLRSLAMAKDYLSDGNFDAAAMALYAGVSGVADVAAGAGDRAGRGAAVGMVGGIAVGSAGGQRGSASAKPPAGGGARRAPIERDSLAGMFRDVRQGQSELAGEQLGTVDVGEETFLAAAQAKADAIGMQTKATADLTAQQELATQAQNEFLQSMDASIESAGRYAGIVGGAMIGAIQAAIKGEMSLGKAVKQVVGQRLEALAIEESILAIAATAKAIGASVWNPAAAAGFWAEAASHAKAAVAAGAGAAILGGGGGGGGGGSSSAAPAAAPTRDTSSAAPADQSRNITVYFGSPVVTATTVAELGREIKSAILTADARYGA